MKTIRLLVITICILVTTLACSLTIPNIQLEIISGNGTTSQEARQVTDFIKVKLNGAGSLIITQGDTENLEIQGEENLLQFITTEVVNKELVIETKKGYAINPTKELTYHLMVKDIHAIELNGLGDIHMDNFHTSELTILINGSGNANIANLKADSLTVAIAGLGDVNVSGEVNSQNVSIGGTGSYKAKELASKIADINISGLGSAGVQVKDSLRATISGGGSIDYLGNPLVEKKVEGLGSINQINK